MAWGKMKLVARTGGDAYPSRILLIDDDENFAQVFAYALEQRVHTRVCVAHDPLEAADVMSRQAFDLVITDWRLPVANGFSLLRGAEQALALDPEAPAEWSQRRQIPVVVVTACDSAEIERERRLGGKFQLLGVVSKEQPMDGILDQVGVLFGNAPVTAAS